MADSAVNGETSAFLRPGYRFTADWTELPGRNVQIFRQNVLVAQGVVDSVTADGAILWLAPHALVRRRLYEKAETYQVWACPGECSACPEHDCRANEAASMASP